ncbi:hemagglutinin [Pseudoscardovia radai]|uniref:hemagglutinin n=1 Tax=Pseudoscardovia radai TaxID=987066 RepID=UPI0039959D48
MNADDAVNEHDGAGVVNDATNDATTMADGASRGVVASDDTTADDTTAGATLDSDSTTTADESSTGATTGETATATPAAPSSPAAKTGRTASWSRSTWISTIALAIVAALVVVALVATAVIAQRRATEISAYLSDQATMARQYGFNPGLIISDDEMFDSTSMTTDEIQDFLGTRGVRCSSSECLATKTFETKDEESDSLCSGYTASSDESAADIISGVAQSCRINPRVLIVMLQKEQGLVTAAEPEESNYTIAMGLSCPDDGDCDTAHYGFFNQVYGAAHRLRYYQAHFNDYSYRPRTTDYIQYNPNESCGGSKVYIENDATAMLYIYTPYQPNEAALAGLANGTGGEGDACSTYGNRNFTLFYNAWFGDPTRGEGAQASEPSDSAPATTATATATESSPEDRPSSTTSGE